MVKATLANARFEIAPEIFLLTAPNGEQVRESTGTSGRRSAQEYEDQKRAAPWRQHKLGEKPRYRWQEAVERWLGE